MSDDFGENTGNTAATDNNEAVSVTVSKDRMAAHISFSVPDDQGQEPGELLTVDQIMDEIARAGVMYGIDRRVIERIANEKVYGEAYLIASGVPPVEGKDGYLVFKFDVAEKSMRPTIRDDGRADFYDLHIFEPAVAEQELVVACPPTEGVNGVNVLGEELPYQALKPAPLLGGENTEIVGDGEKLVASRGGQVIFDGRRVSVSSVLTIEGDIGMATGNIEFCGDIVVRGNVLSGFSVVAEGSVEVFGSVEGAFLKSGTDMRIHGGIHGLDKTEIVSGGHMTAKFIENSKISSDGDIYSSIILHSDVSCAGSVLLDGNKCMIAGGKISAGKSVKAKIIGSAMATVTEIHIGIAPKIMEKYEESKAEYQKLRVEFDKISSVCDILSNLKEKNQLSEEKKDIFLKAIYSKTHLRDRLNALKTETDTFIMPCMNENEGVLYAGVIRAGVRVMIGNAMLYVRDDIPACRLSNEKGTIVIGSYTGG